MVASTSRPSFHWISISKPPRARRPLTAPLGQALGKRGQKFDLAGMALQEHLGDAGGAAEIAVDLERRMGVEHVRIGAVGMQKGLRIW